MVRKAYTSYLLVCVDDGIEGQTVSPTCGEVFQLHVILVSAKIFNLHKAGLCLDQVLLPEDLVILKQNDFNSYPSRAV